MRTLSRLASASFFMLLALGLFGQPALAQIAPGVTQSAAHAANISGIVTQSSGTPVAGADVRLSGPSILTTKSDDRGVFSFTSVPWGDYQLHVTSSLGVATRLITVNGDLNVAIQYQAPSGMHTIAHVSASNAGVSINVTLASVFSVSPSQFAFQGNTSWQQLLNEIPGVAVSGAIGGGELEGDYIPGSPFMPVVLSINGALPYETSVTLDGMPLQNVSWNTEMSAGGGLDLSYLPMSVFDTADVVRGPGANAPSIVDSIGGSFVLHPPDLVDQNQFNISESTDLYGGLISNARVQLHLGRLSATLAYGANNSPGPLGNNSKVPFGWAWPPATINGLPFTCTNAAGCGGYPADTGSGIYRNCFCVQQTSLIMCCTPWSTSWSVHDGAVGLAYKIGSSITADVFYTAAGSSTEEAVPQTPLEFLPNNNYSGAIGPGTYNTLIAALGPYHLTQNSYLWEEKLADYTALGVFRFAAVQNSSSVTSHLNAGQPDGTYVLYGTGIEGAAPVTFNGSMASVTFPAFTWDSDFYVHNRDLLGSYAVQIGNASSAGVSYVTSYYDAPYNYSFTYGAPTPVFSTTQPPDISETTNETRINASTQAGSLSLDASWYFAGGAYHVTDPSDPNERSDSLFTYNAPRFGATWRLNPNTIIRGAAGGGFALPPLENISASNGTLQCFGSYCTQTVTNLNLKPEKAFSYDIGSDIRLSSDTAVSFDVYRANLYGQFFQSSNITGISMGVPLYTTEYENLGQSRFEGVNLAMQHVPLRGFYERLAIGLTRAYVVAVPAGFYDSSSGRNSVNTYIVSGINFSGSYESGLPAIPYANGSAQLGYRWTTGKYIDVSPTYYGNNNSYFFPAFIEFDAHAGYSFTKSLSLLITFRNFTGVHDQSYQLYAPSLGAPATVGQLYPLFGIPYGPRALLVTLNVKS